jgi:hypothetical protein
MRLTEAEYEDPRETIRRYLRERFPGEQADTLTDDQLNAAAAMPLIVYCAERDERDVDHYLRNLPDSLLAHLEGLALEFCAWSGGSESWPTEFGVLATVLWFVENGPGPATDEEMGAACAMLAENAFTEGNRRAGVYSFVGPYSLAREPARIPAREREQATAH